MESGRNDDEQAGRVARRDFLRLSGGAAALSVFGGSTLISSCGDKSPTRESRSNPNVVVMTNPTDPLFLRVSAPGGRMIEYYGSRDEGGVPQKLEHVIVTQAGASQRFTLGANDEPARIDTSNGTQILLEWTGATTAVMTVISPSGEYQVNTPVDFASPGAAAVAWSRSARTRVAADGVETRGGRRVSLEVSPIAVSPVAATGAGNVVVNVYRCGSLDTGQVAVNVLAHSLTGALLFSAPATRVSDGVYQATLPTNITPSLNPQQICRSTADVFGYTCLLLKGPNALDPTAVLAICNALAVALDVVTIPSGEAALMIAGCHAAVPAWQTYCATLDASAHDGVDSLSTYLCNGVFEDRRIASDVRLHAEVVALPTTIKSGTATAPPAGPYPALSVNMGGEAAIRSLELNPSNPAQGTSYVATARIFCVPAGARVRLSIEGTDGYTDSRSYDVASTTVNGVYTLTVPGAGSGVQDQVTVTVTLPLGGVLSRSAALVFGS